MDHQWDRARDLWRELEPVMSLIWQGDYVQSVYAGAQLTGYGAGSPRRPLARLPAYKVDVLKAALGSLIERESSAADAHGGLARGRFAAQSPAQGLGIRSSVRSTSSMSMLKPSPSGLPTT